MVPTWLPVRMCVITTPKLGRYSVNIKPGNLASKNVNVALKRTHFRQLCSLAKINSGFLSSSDALWRSVSEPRCFGTTSSLDRTWHSKFQVDLAEEDFFTYILGHLEEPALSETALIDGISGTAFTYAELRKKSITIGNSMMQRGYRKDDVVAIHSPNLPEYIMTILGCAYAGLTITVVSPLATPTEVVRQLTETKARALFVFPKFAKSAFQTKENVDTLRDVIFFGAPFVANPTLKLYLMLFHGEQTCWLIKDLIEPSQFTRDAWSIEKRTFDVKKDVFLLPYSSGTTGLPKGVVHTHYTVVAYIEQVYKSPNFNILRHCNAGFLALLPLFHNFGFNVAFVALKNEGFLVTNPLFNKKLLLKSIQNYKLDMIPMVPPLVKFLSSEPIVEEYDVTSIKIILSGGAPLNKDTALAMNKKFPHIEMVQGWGMTEGLISSSAGEAGCPVDSLGVLMPNVSAKVVDLDTGEELDVDEVGEFVVKTPSALTGYLDNPEETAEAFVEIDGETWLRTGDVGYFNDKEYIFLVDRIKEMIKYKGHQMSPVEIEGVITEMEQVADAAVAGFPCADIGELPAAFIVPVEGAKLKEEDVEKYVEDNMAHQNHLRGGVYFVDEIPRSIAGKILRRELKLLVTKMGYKGDYCDDYPSRKKKKMEPDKDEKEGEESQDATK